MRKWDSIDTLGVLALVCLMVFGCAYDPQPGPTPDPKPGPMTETEKTLHRVIVAYAKGCGDSLVVTEYPGNERAYNAALKTSRTESRIDAHGPEDQLLAEAAGEPAKVKAIGEAWRSLAKRLEAAK